MKCPADVVTVCDEQPECECGFCKEHCSCIPTKKKKNIEKKEMVRFPTSDGYVVFPERKEALK